MAGLKISLLGPLQITKGEKLLSKFESNKVRALLAYLVVEINRPHSREALTELLWPESPSQSAFGNLRYALADLRRVLGDAFTQPPYLLISRECLQFNALSPYELDAASFVNLLQTDDIDRLKQAIALCRGDFLAGFPSIHSNSFEEWVSLKREQFRQRTIEALRLITEHHEQRGEYQQALPFARRQVELEPWLEEAHQQLMRVLALDGQRSAALAQYETCHRVLTSELDVEPSRETFRLFEAIRDGKLVTLPPTLRLTSEERPRPVFVGRQAELDQLEAVLIKVLAGHGQIAFVTGSPGSGKTALLGEFLRRAADTHNNLLTATGNCNAYTGIGDPYLPFIEIIQWLTADCEAKKAESALSAQATRRLLAAQPTIICTLTESAPDLLGRFVRTNSLLDRARSLGHMSMDAFEQLEKFIETHPQATVLSEATQADLFEQYTHFLSSVTRKHPLILIIDDLQWADQASISFLFHLGKRLAGQRIFLIGAYRPEEVEIRQDGSRHPLETVINEFTRDFGETRIDLDHSESRAFVDALIDSEPNCLGVKFRETLGQHTNGHPLFTVELLRGFQERGELAKNIAGQWMEASAPDWEKLPARVDAVIAERIGRLPEAQQVLLSAASVEGETFTAEVLACVCTQDVETVIRQLSGVLSRQHRLVKAEGSQQMGTQYVARYRFGHFLFQKYLYQRLDEVERSRLHAAIGGALEGLSGDYADEIAVQLARHFMEAGQLNGKFSKKAVHYFLKAGDRARVMYAHLEAVAHYEQALQLIQKAGDDEQAARVNMKLGVAHHNAFEYEQAHRAFDVAFWFWQQSALRQDYPALTPQNLRINWLPVASIDPAFAWDIPGAVGWQLFSGLLIFSPELEITPDLARKWEIHAGGREYIFHLKDNLRWSDGTPLTAGDFEFSGKRMLAQKTGAPCANLLYDVKGAKDFHKGLLHDPNEIGLRALDPATLLIELEKPAPYFLQLLGNFLPVPRHCMELFGDKWTEPEHIVSHGPFRLQAWDKCKYMLLGKDPYFHADFNGNVQNVELHFGTDPAGQLEMFAAGQLDVVDMLLYPTTCYEKAIRQFAGEYFSFPRAMIHFIGFDVCHPPFDDQRVRRAFALAIDKKFLAGSVQKNAVFPATGGFVPPDLPGYSAGIALPFDPDQAQESLSSAGYPCGKGFPRIRAVTHMSAENPVNSYLSSQWREIIGVEVTWETAVPRLPLIVDDNPPNLFVSHWFGDYPDPDDFLGASQLRSWTGWQEQAFVDLLEETRNINNQSKRLALYMQADKMLAESAAIIPLTYDRQHLLIKPWVKRYPTSPLYTWFWKDVVIEPH